MVLSFSTPGVTAGQSLVQSEVNNVSWQRFFASLPTRDDVISLLVAIEEICQFHADDSKELAVGYEVLSALSESERVSAHVRKDFLTASAYMQMKKNKRGQVGLADLMSVITRTISYRGIYASLALHSLGDPHSRSITSIDGLEDWLYRQTHRLVQIQKMTEQFVPLWVFTAAHTISFFHGRQVFSQITNRTTTTISISEFTASDTMKQLLQMGKPLVDDMDSNPFARLRAVRYYDSFTVFDAATAVAPESGPGDQCCIMAGGYMSPSFMNRFISAQGGTSLDYRRFLNFAIAWDNRKTKQGVSYFWSTLDFSGKGFVSRDDLLELATGMLALLQCLPSACGPQGPHAVAILVDEILDIFRSSFPSGSERDQTNRVVTLKQALEAPTAFGTVVGILGNSQAFIDYECREDTTHKQFIAKQVKDARAARAKAATSTRADQLTRLQSIIDDCWFAAPAVVSKFPSFAEFLDYHEATYGGQSMEPWLSRYYQWEVQEAAEAAQRLTGETVNAADRKADSVGEAEVEPRE